MGDDDFVGLNPVVAFDGVRVFHGDCRDMLAELPDDSVDSIVTDPPYELGFMGKKWDASGIAYDSTVWGECLRVLKPGGHLLAFGGTRTWHRLAVAVEDAGFEIRDNIAWMYGSGFPKSLDVSKAIDKRGGNGALLTKEIGEALRVAREARGMSKSKADEIFCDGTTNWSWFEGRPAGQRPPTPETFSRIVAEWPELADLSEKVAEAEREVIGQHPAPAKSIYSQTETTLTNDVPLTAPATSEAEKWQGWGTALKPAFEPIVVARKPLMGTVAGKVLEWGTGGLNIDGSRIGSDSRFSPPGGIPNGANNYVNTDKHRNVDYPSKIVQGRWPANVILDEYTAGLLDEQSGVVKSAGKYKNPGVVKELGTRGWQENDNFLNQMARKSLRDNSYANETGGASRFFYVAKASKRDRNEGLDGLEARIGENGNKWTDQDYRRGDEKPTTARQNFHPTVKPTALMRYLVKLVTPPGGTVLDPFTGSGSTGKAAVLEGFQFVGVELTEDYLPIIEGRLKWAIENQDEGTLF